MIRNIVAIVLGVMVGAYVNRMIIENGHHLITLPEGFTFSDPENLKKGLLHLPAKYFFIPFLAHAAGTFVGALIAAKLAISNKIRFAVAISMAFLLAGIIMVFILEAPLWFEITDLAVAYLPMGYLAGKIADKKS